MRTLRNRWWFLLLVAVTSSVQAYLSNSPWSTRQEVSRTGARSTSLLFARKRGKRLDRELGAKDVNWIPLPSTLTASSLPTKPDQVQFLDTQLPALVNTNTNPTGAVSVIQHGGKTYCFSHACPRCRVPLNKARVAETPDAGVVLGCDFCSAKFSLESGQPLVGDAEVEAAFPRPGLFSGVTSKLFEAQAPGPLPTYKLSQVGSKLNIAMES